MKFKLRVLQLLTKKKSAEKSTTSKKEEIAVEAQKPDVIETTAKDLSSMTVAQLKL